MKQCFIIMIIVVCVWCIMFQCRIVFNFILLPKQTAFKILNIVQCCPSSNSIKYWPSWTSDCSDVRVYLLCVSKQVFNKMQKYDNCPHSTSHYIMLEKWNSNYYNSCPYFVNHIQTRITLLKHNVMGGWVRAVVIFLHFIEHLLTDTK
jgi:hypothetical protein